jgi:predicted dinucleotide-binding enzyme
VRIIVVSGAGTIGKAAVKALSDRHEIVVAGRRSGTVHVDIRSPGSARAFTNMWEASTPLSARGR